MAASKSKMKNKNYFSKELLAKCLKIQLSMCVKGKSAQDSVRENGFLFTILTKYQKTETQKKGDIPCLINFFISSVSSPINHKNQNALRSIIPHVISVLDYMKKKRNQKSPIEEHWKLLQALLTDNPKNVKTFITKGGNELLKEYWYHRNTQSLKRIMFSLQCSGDEFIKNSEEKKLTEQAANVQEINCPKESSIEASAKEISANSVSGEEEMDATNQDLDHVPAEDIDVDHEGTTENNPGNQDLQEIVTKKENEVSFESGKNESAVKSLEKSKLALEELNRVLARTKMRREERRLRESLELKTRNVEGGSKESPAKKFLNIVKRLSWSKKKMTS